MHIQYKMLWLVACTIEACICQSEEDNSTVASRREILEKRAVNAYQNACYGMQELSNWMSVVFKIKSVWAGSTIAHMEENSGRNLDAGQRIIPTLPPRPKRVGSECSLRSAQVTLQTYAHLQGQLFYLKSLLGRSIVKSGGERLGDVNISLRERIKVLDVFNETLNDIFSKLRQGTQEISSQARSGNWNARILQIPSNIFQVKPEELKADDSAQSEHKPRGFFQTLGRTLDKMMFPAASKNSRIDTKKTAIERESLGTLDDNIKHESSEQIQEQIESDKPDN